MKFLYLVMLVGFLGLYSCGGNNSANSQDNPRPQNNVRTGGGSYQKIAKTPSPDRKISKLDLKIEIENGPPGSYYLMGIVTDRYFVADSTTARNGKLEFTNEEGKRPGVYLVYFPDRTTSFQVLLDADQEFTMKTSMADLVGNMKIKGSIDNELLYQSLVYEKSQTAALQEVSQAFSSNAVGSDIHNEFIEKHYKLAQDKLAFLRTLFKKAPESLFTAFKESGQNPALKYEFNADGTLTASYLNQLRKEYWDNVNFADDRLLFTPVASNKLERFYNKFLPQQPDSINLYSSRLVDQVLDYPEYFKYFANWITLKYEPTKTTLMDAEAVFVHMIQNYFTKERAFWQDSVASYGLQLRAHEMAQSLVGKIGPDVTATGPDGKSYSLMDLKADYIAVYMWNPECEHCQEQSPKLVEFYHEWKNKGFDIYGIVLDTEKQPWLDAIKKYGMTWTNVIDPTNRNIYAKYFVDNTPELYLLNPERKIIGKNLKVYQLSQVIEQDKANRN